MVQAIREVMTKDIVALPSDASVEDASRRMKDRDIGDVMVLQDEAMVGILTDRDIVIRAIAEGRSPSDTRIGEVASRDVATVSPDDSVESVIQIMRTQALRRVPVAESGKPLGIVSIGDLAIERDRTSALADISAATPNEWARDRDREAYRHGRDGAPQGEVRSRSPWREEAPGAIEARRVRC